MFQTFQKNGRRWSCADAYLRPAMKRDNLEVITHAEVQRLELSGTRVTGVLYKRKGKERVARAGREVILSAGAFNSPQILMLSGIGPSRGPPGGRRAGRATSCPASAATSRTTRSSR